MSIRLFLLFLSLYCCHLHTRAQETTTSCNFGDCRPLELLRACADGSPGYKCVLKDNNCVAEATDCPLFRPCVRNTDCNATQFCSKTSCSESDTGVCQTVYDVCPAVYAPVCGCDGKTYSSRCDAQNARVSVLHDGSCDGANCTVNYECKRISFCSKSSGCNTGGNCKPRPEVCFDIEDPVCGCDGVTYPNQCYAERSGVVAGQSGACPKNQTQCNIESCGPRPLILSRLCPDNITVEGYTGRCLPSPSGTSCFWERISCPQKPCDITECTPLEIFRPCADGSPGYICVRNSTGQCITQATSCPVEPTRCSNTSECQPGSFCKKSTCNAEFGICTITTVACTTEYNPVCGCNGKTYSSVCSALIAHQNVNYLGECESTRPQPRTDPPADLCAITDCQPLEIFRPCADGSPGYRCVRNASGQCFAQPTYCPVDPTCYNDSQCGPGSFCNKPTCDAQQGRCIQYAAVDCTAEYKPVCGCDGKTYGSVCDAIVHQQNVKYTGECNGSRPTEAPSGANRFCGPDDCQPLELFRACADGSRGYVCVRNGAGCVAQPTGCPIQDTSSSTTCQADDECGTGSYCKKESCGSRSGKCFQKNAMVCSQLYAPVCGCNGTTFSSRCMAALAGQNVYHDGPCTQISAPEIRVCYEDSECGSGSFCQKSSCKAVYGRCTSLQNPRCSRSTGPVCGCDNVQYASSCQAALKGVNINSNNRACRSRDRSKRSRK